MTIEILPSVRLLGLTGSLRRQSFSTAVLRGLKISLAPDIALTLCEPRLPLYNEDEDGDAAAHEVRLFRAAIASSDGIVIATPEYNHGIPGVLKNALDWASRPLGAAALTDKPVVVMSVSPAFTGGVRAQAHVHDTLLAVRARIVGGPQVVIANVTEKISGGRLVDQLSLDFARAAIERMMKDLAPAIPAPPTIETHAHERGAV